MSRTDELSLSVLSITMKEELDKQLSIFQMQASMATIIILAAPECRWARAGLFLRKYTLKKESPFTNLRVFFPCLPCDFPTHGLWVRTSYHTTENNWKLRKAIAPRASASQAGAFPSGLQSCITCSQEIAVTGLSEGHHTHLREGKRRANKTSSAWNEWKWKHFPQLYALVVAVPG